MSFPPSAHEHFANTLERFQQVREWLDSALATVFESEMQKLAKRFPRRRIELHSGMGSTQIEISHRREKDFRYQWNWSNGSDPTWPEWLEEPAPDLWSAIRTYQDEVSDGKDPGLGSIVYENGQRIKGLPEGGA